MKFKEYLLKKRTERDLTRKQLSDMLGDISQDTIKSWEYGLSYPNPESLTKLSYILKIKYDYLSRLLCREKYMPIGATGDEDVKLVLLENLTGKNDVTSVIKKLLERLEIASDEVLEKLPPIRRGLSKEAMKQEYLNSYNSFSKDAPYMYKMIGEQVLNNLYVLTDHIWKDYNDIITYWYRMVCEYTSYQNMKDDLERLCKDNKEAMQAFDFFDNDYWSVFKNIKHSRTFELTILVRQWLCALYEPYLELQKIEKEKHIYENSDEQTRITLLADNYAQKILLQEI